MRVHLTGHLYSICVFKPKQIKPFYKTGSFQSADCRAAVKRLFMFAV